MFARIVFEVEPNSGTWLKFETWAGPLGSLEGETFKRRLLGIGWNEKRIKSNSLRVGLYYRLPSPSTRLLASKDAAGVMDEIFSGSAPITMIGGLSSDISTFIEVVDGQLRPCDPRLT